MFGGQPPLNAAAIAGPTWQKISFPFALSRACNKGEGELFFTLGIGRQTVEIGGVELVDYGATKKVADLPSPNSAAKGANPTQPGARPPASIGSAKATSPSS